MAKYTPIGDYKSKLIANYKFEETSGTVCTDSKGSYNGTYTGTTSVAGEESNARSFNGTSDYVQFANPVIPSGKKSIKFKIKKNGNPLVSQYLIDNKGDLVCLGENGAIYWIVYNEFTNWTSSFVLNSNISICDNQWHTVMLTWDGTTNANAVKLYIDDLLVPNKTTTPLNTQINNSINLKIGSSSYLANYFLGQLDEVEIYNDVITYKDVEKTKLVDIKNIGECIASRYTVPVSGVAGFFSELGETLAPLIPLVSSALPDGKFYWIYVGKDYLGRKKFIADRNIQHSISWDTLNSFGICSEKIVDLGLENNYVGSIRLLTGGTSATDTDNEWDKIIVGSTLGGTITAGDNNVWNWNVSVRSWTSTSNASTTRVLRGVGGGTVDAFFSIASSDATVGRGFRPVLLVESLASYPIINNANKTIINNGLKLNISMDNITHQTAGTAVKYKVSVTKPDASVVLKRDYDSSFQATPLAFNTLEFNSSEFASGTNVITVNVIDNNNLTTSWSVNVIKNNVTKTLFLDGDNLKYLNEFNEIILLQSNYSISLSTNIESLFLINGMSKNVSITNLKTSIDNINSLKLLIYKGNQLS